MNGMEVRAALARNIKAFRDHRNWTQADLAEKSGISIVYLSDIERGNKWPYLDTMVKLAEAFKVEVYELIKPENVPPPTATTVLNKYAEEVNAIFAKAFEMTEKNTARSLAALHNKYLTPHLKKK